VEHVVIRKKIDPKALLWILFALAAIPWLSYRALYEINFQRALADARALFERKAYAESEARLGSILKTWGPRSRALAFEVELQCRLGMMEDSPRRWHRVLQATAELGRSWFSSGVAYEYARGLAYFNLGPDTYLDGIQALGRARPPAALEAERSELLYTMCLAKKRFNDAETHALRLVALHPDEPEYRIRKVLVDLARGEKLRAQGELKDLLVTVPNGPSLRRTARLLLNLLGEFQLPEEKQFVYLYLLHRMPDDTEWISDYGAFLFQNNQIYKARTLVYEALLKSQTNLVLRQSLARMF